MLKFRPISYAEADFRAYKYNGAACREGKICQIGVGSKSNRSIITATPISLTTTKVVGTLDIWGAGTSGSMSMINYGMYFPIYREDPDPDNITPTIAKGDYVIGMHLHPGSEFEIHKTCLHKQALGSYANSGFHVAVATTGKLVAYNHRHATKLVIGETVGTFNATWLRVRCF